MGRIKISAHTHMSVCGILIPTIFFFLIEHILVYYYDVNDKQIFIFGGNIIWIILKTTKEKGAMTFTTS